MIMVSVYPQCVVRMVRMMRISLLDVLEEGGPGARPLLEAKCGRGGGGAGDGGREGGWPPPECCFSNRCSSCTELKGAGPPFKPGGLRRTSFCCWPGSSQTRGIPDDLTALFHGNSLVPAKAGHSTIGRPSKIFDVCQEFLI